MPKRKLIVPELGQVVDLGEISNESISEESEKIKEDRLITQYEVRKKFGTLSDQIAESNIYFRNYRYPKGREIYPDDLQSDFRIVTKAYPYAKGGMLLVDEPKTEKEASKMYEKQKRLKKLGLRHIVIEKTGHLHTTYADCLEQLGEL